MLSILIPTFNDDCHELVKGLALQAQGLGLTNCEIIVADDGSTDASVVASNQSINNITGCRYVKRDQNVGRAAIRNFLAAQAHGDYLLFIDADMTLVNSHYLERYAKARVYGSVTYGGYCVGDGESSNLRYVYERKGEKKHSAALRSLHPYQDFHTSNFMIPREVMLSIPFDERFIHYGYEDVLFGKQLLARGVPIIHIDNPLCFSTFESNGEFIKKTEEGLRTLRNFSDELRGYSSLLNLSEKIERYKLKWLSSSILRILKRPLLKCATSQSPNLLAFSLYKLGYYLNLEPSSTK